MSYLLNDILFPLSICLSLILSPPFLMPLLVCAPEGINVCANATEQYITPPVTLLQEKHPQTLIAASKQIS